jgi:Flp pilus assembly protein TadG
VRRRLAKRLLGDDRGTTTIEFALVFPLLAAVLFGIIDVGRFIGSRVMLAQAASVGARTACLNSTDSQTIVDNAVAVAAPMLVGVSVPTIDCLGACGWPKTPADRLVVTAQYNFQATFFRTLTKTMTQTSRMVCE